MVYVLAVSLTFRCGISRLVAMRATYVPFSPPPPPCSTFRGRTSRQCAISLPLAHHLIDSYISVRKPHIQTRHLSRRFRSRARLLPPCAAVAASSQRMAALLRRSHTPIHSCNGWMLLLAFAPSGLCSFGHTSCLHTAPQFVPCTPRACGVRGITLSAPFIVLSARIAA
jgi:hypothetical protein